jgi:6-methylsalicylate decarboxylase
MRIDFHQHVWTNEVRDALERRSEPPRLAGGRLALPIGGEFHVEPQSYDPATRLQALREAGLDAAVVSLPPTSEPTQEVIDVWHESAPALAASSQGRFIPLAYRSARPGFAGSIVAARDLTDLGRLAPLLGRLERAEQILFVHPGPARAAAEGWWAAGVEYSCQMQAAFAAWVARGAARWPRLQVVFALLGGGAPFQVERLIRRGLAAGAPFAPNIWFESSSYGERALELSLQTFGAARLLFGSDAPVDLVRPARSVVASFGSALETQMLSSNPATVLRLEQRLWAA